MSLSEKVFNLMLVAYPREFRREYGPHMAQAFRDCCRAKSRGEAFGLDLWLRTLADLLTSAAREHLDNFRKDHSAMNNGQRNLMAIVGCIAIIVLAFFLLSYGRSHEVAPILFIGRILDAMVTAGIAGNLIIFLLRITKLEPIKTALWTMLVVNIFLATLALMIGSRVDPDFRLGSVLFAYVVSFIFWFALHWVWAKGNKQLAVEQHQP